MKTKTDDSHLASVEIASKAKIYLFIAALIAIVCTGFAQSKTGSIKVWVADKEHRNEGLPFANVVVYNGTTQVAAGVSDPDGYAQIKELAPGKYNVKTVYVGYETKETNDVLVSQDKVTYLPVVMENKYIILCGVTVTAYTEPLIDCCCISGCSFGRTCYCGHTCCKGYLSGIDEGQENASAKKSLKYYPNPTNGKITLEAKDEIEELSLVDESGRLRGQYAINKSETIEQDLSGNPNGLYILQYQSKGKLYREKILLIH